MGSTLTEAEAERVAWYACPAMIFGVTLWLVLCLLASVAHAEEGEDEAPARPRLVAQAGHARSVLDVAHSPDGRFVLTCGDSTARLWDAASGRELRHFTARAGVVKALAFSPDSRQALTAETGALCLWDVATGAEVRRFEGDPEYAFRDVAISADGRYVVTAGPGRLAVIWSMATGAALRRIEGHERSVYAVAFSPDGRWIASAGKDRTARLWDATTGQEVRRFEGHTRLVRSVAFSPDGRRIATGSWDGSARVWNCSTGGEDLRLSGQPAWVFDVAYSPDGRRDVTASHDGTSAIWSARDGRLLRRLTGHRAEVNAACFTADGRHVLTGGEDRLALLFEVETGAPVRRFGGRAERLIASCLSPDGRHVLTTGYDGQIRQWDTRAGTPQRVLRGHEGAVRAVRYSRDGARIVTAGDDRTARVWDAHTGRELLCLRGHRYAVWSAAFSGDGRQILTASRDKTARLWDAVTGEEVRCFEGHEMLVADALPSPDGHSVLTGSLDGTARLWETATGREVRRFAGSAPLGVAYVGFSPDGRRVVTGGPDRTLRVWSTATAEEELRLEGHTGAIRSVCFSPDGKGVLSASCDGTARLWDVVAGKEQARLAGHTDEVFMASFSPDGRRIVTSGDATARFWDAASGDELCRLVHFGQASWAVAAPDGRFDTDWIEELPGLHWVMPDDPVTPLTIEIFARDYYEPRLLPRILAGAPFRPVRALQDLNRVQPTVRITRIEADPGREGSVSVTVEVERHRRVRDGQEYESGACDLRLFRDGRLVRYREGALAPAPDGDRTSHVFSGVSIPQARQVPFSAYAFNTDGVKGPTHRQAYVPRDSRPEAPRERSAYVVSMGVDAFDDERWNLRFAVADANALCTTLTDRLTGSGAYDRIVPVLLTSTRGVAGNARGEDLETVLRLLAGIPVTPEQRLRIPGAEHLRPARPEDLFVLTVSTHGHTDTQGRFYLLPSNVATGVPTAPWLASCISAEELSRRLRDVDAGEMVMILDACHAAASVEGEGFKPGPMGSRGLGQIAYDKRMQILAASQAADVALESARIRHGLLTYALVHDGLEQGRADFDPPDGLLSLTEWLRYGALRVPVLGVEVLGGTLPASDARGPLLDPRRVRRTRPVVQQPSLFDFARRAPPVELRK